MGYLTYPKQIGYLYRPLSEIDRVSIWHIFFYRSRFHVFPRQVSYRFQARFHVGFMIWFQLGFHTGFIPPPCFYLLVRFHDGFIPSRFAVFFGSVLSLGILLVKELDVWVAKLVARPTELVEDGFASEAAGGQHSCRRERAGGGGGGLVARELYF